MENKVFSIDITDLAAKLNVFFALALYEIQCTEVFSANVSESIQSGNNQVNQTAKVVV